MPVSNKILKVKQRSIDKVKKANIECCEINEDPIPFLIVMCNGYVHQPLIYDELEKANILIRDQKTLSGFFWYAKQIYGLNELDDYSFLWLAALLQENRKAANDILLLTFNGNVSLFNKLREIKTTIREKIGLWHRQVRYYRQVFTIEQHFIHSPEISEAAYQYNLLFNLTEKATRYLSEKN